MSDETYRPADLEDIEGVGELSPGAKFVLYVLNQYGPLRSAEISDITGIPPRTVRCSITTIRERTDVLEDRPDPSAPRGLLYYLDTDGAEVTSRARQ